MGAADAREAQALAPLTPRRATREDLPELGRMLARAFLDDPVMNWACKPEHLRLGATEKFFAARLRHLVDDGDIWTTPELSSAALWAQPGKWRTTFGQDLELARSFLHPRLAVRGPMIAAGLLSIERKHPDHEPHWYLAVLGTDPSAQGQGLGSKMLAPVLEDCDRDGVAAFLESSKERNIAFYARHGFRVTDELKLPRGPKVWQMWRDPR